MQISNGELIWKFDGFDCESFGLATQYVAAFISIRNTGFPKLDLNYEQWVDLICLSFSPDGHDTKLTPQIFNKMKNIHYLGDCKKKLCENLDLQRMRDDIGILSEALGTLYPENMKTEKGQEKISG